MVNSDMPQPQPKSLSKEQKTGFVLLLVFGILAVGLGGLQMRNNIYNPFALNAGEAGQATAFVSEDIRLQQIDTDQDGLNDFEELTFYETSPYLPDTDSDGVGDKEEIEAETDPLCPEGQNCGAVNPDEIPEDTDNIAEPLQDGFTNPLDTLDSFAGVGQADGEQMESLEDIVSDPDKIRDLLLKSGQISAEDLEKFDDKTLIDLAEQLYAENKDTVVEEKADSVEEGSEE